MDQPVHTFRQITHAELSQLPEAEKAKMLEGLAQATVQQHADLIRAQLQNALVARPGAAVAEFVVALIHADEPIMDKAESVKWGQPIGVMVVERKGFAYGLKKFEDDKGDRLYLGGGEAFSAPPPDGTFWIAVIMGRRCFVYTAAEKPAEPAAEVVPEVSGEIVPAPQS